MSTKATDSDFAQVFEALRKILKKHEARLVVESNNRTKYVLNTKVMAKNKKPVFFGAVWPRKRAISYGLMPVYTFPDLLKGMSPELKARMQGKSCFNFARVDRSLFAELARLTKRGYDRYKKEGLI